MAAISSNPDKNPCIGYHPSLGSKQEKIEMRLSFRWLLPLALLVVVSPLIVLAADDVLPHFISVDPLSGKIGTVITVTGENISKTQVAKVYFTDGKNDIEVPTTEHTDTSLKVTIPAKAKVGVRYRLMILTTGKEPKLIEQPVRVEVEE
jgi:hypothetical protein